MGSVNMRAHDHRISIIKRVTSCVAALCIVGMSCVHAQERIGVAAAVNQVTSDLTLDEERKLIESGYKIIQNHTISTDRIGKAQMLLIVYARCPSPAQTRPGLVVGGDADAPMVARMICTLGEVEVESIEGWRGGCGEGSGLPLADRQG